MTDLTRRVLDAHTRYTAPDLHAEQADIDGPLLIDAAPILARQVEAVEALADRLEAEGDRIGTSGGGATVRAFAAEIRTALNGDTND